MKKDLIFPDLSTSLEDILREGAKKLLQQAIENEGDIVKSCVPRF